MEDVQSPAPVDEAETPTAEAYSELQHAYDYFNRVLFENILPPCLITLQRKKRTYGYFSSERFVHREQLRTTDEIAINPAYFCARPVAEVLSTLVHEMVHGWQFHFGKPGRRGYHNREWGEKMESLGLMPSNTGQPGGARTGERMSHYVIEGGPFSQATAKLLGDGYDISWLDRFPSAVATGTVTLVGVEGAGGKRDKDDEGDKGLQGKTEKGGESTGSRGPTLSDLIVPKAPPKATPTNRSNRLKYRCPSCSAQAWGKPGLVLLCGVEGCNAAVFEAVG